MAEDTAVLEVTDTPIAEAEAPETDTAEVEVGDGDTEKESADTEPTPELLTPEREKAIREEAAQTAIAEMESKQTIEAYQRTSAAHNQWLNSTAASEIAGMIRWGVEKVESGQMTAAQVLAQINLQNIEGGTGLRLSSAIQTRDRQIVEQDQEAWLAKEYPGWRVPPELARKKEQALASGDTLAVRRIWREIDRAADREVELPKLAQKLAAENAAKDKKAAGVEKALEGDKARASAERPTAVSGGGNSGSLAFTNKQIEEMSVTQWNSYTAEQREQILNNPKRWK